MCALRKERNHDEVHGHLLREASQVIQVITNAAEHIVEHGMHQDHARVAYEYLESRPDLRQALFHHHGSVITMEDVTEFFFGVLSPIPVTFDVHSKHFMTINKRSVAMQHRKKYVTELFLSGPLRGIFLHFPCLMRLNLHGNVLFLENIVGSNVLQGVQSINVHDIYRRLHLAEFTAMNDTTMYQRNPKLGSVWLEHYENGAMSALVDIQKGVAEFLCSLSKKGYLDELAGVVVVKKTAGTHGCVRPINILKDPLGKDASAIAQWDYPLSPAFIKYATTEGLNDMLFMTDPGDSKGGRLLRVESADVRPDRPILFQVGGGTKSVVHQARNISGFGKMVLKIANYLSSQVHGFIVTEMKARFDSNFVARWAPRLPQYDLINHQVSMKKSAIYDWHSDAKCMLVDNNKPGWSAFYLWVPTFVISNSVDNVSSINFRHANPAINLTNGKMERGLAGRRMNLAAESLHFQLYGSNSSFQHRPEIIQDSPQHLTRWAITCRETTILQESGMRELKNVNSGVKVVGNCGDYSTKLVWNPRPGQPSNKASDSSEPTTIGKKKRGKVSKDARGGENDSDLPQPPVSERIQPLRLTGGWITRRPPKNTEDGAVHGFGFLNWPTAPVQRIATSPHSLMQVLCSSNAVPFLNQYKCTVTCHLPNKDGTLRPVPMAPLWNHHTNQPYKPGDFFDAVYLSEALGMTHSPEHHGIWKEQNTDLNAYVAYQPYKQQLAGPSDPEGGLLKEVERVIEGKKLRGFWITGSGGNPNAAGTFAATGDRPVVQSEGSNGHFTIVAGNQTVVKSINSSMLEAMEWGKRINLFASGNCLPLEKRRDGEGRLQTMYLGPGIIDGVSHVRDSREELKAIASWPGNEAVEHHYLEHRASKHYRFHFIPDDGIDFSDPNEKWNEWKHLHVCSDNVIKLKQNISNCSANHSQLYSPMSENPKPSIDSMLEQMFREDHHLILENRLLASKGSNKSLPKAKTMTVTMATTDGEVAGKQTTYNICHVPWSIAEFDPEIHQSISLGIATRRTVSPEMFLVYLQNLSVSVAARMMKMNVDSERRVGPLLDPTTRKGPNIDRGRNGVYSLVFGSDEEGTRRSYLDNLSYIFQRRAFPCAIRTFDVKVWYYINHNVLRGERIDTDDGLGWMKENFDKVCDLFYQAVVTEMSGRVTSTRQFCRDQPSCDSLERHEYYLPTLADHNDYMDWMERRCNMERDGKMIDMLPGQYDLDPIVETISSYRSFLSSLVAQIDHVVNNILCKDWGNIPDRRNAIITELYNNFTEKGCGQNQKLIFMVGQIIANMEESIGGDPFGKAVGVPCGSGSISGLSLIDFDAMHKSVHPGIGVPEKITRGEKLDLILAFLRLQSDDILRLLFIQRDNEGQLLVCGTSRRVDRKDAEHMACKIYLVFEVLPSGGRAFSANPKLSFPHCHPVKDYHCPRLNETAGTVMEVFKSQVEAGTWISPVEVSKQVTEQGVEANDQATDLTTNQGTNQAGATDLAVEQAGATELAVEQATGNATHQLAHEATNQASQQKRSSCKRRVASDVPIVSPPRKLACRETTDSSDEEYELSSMEDDVEGKNQLCRRSERLRSAVVAQNEDSDNDTSVGGKISHSQLSDATTTEEEVVCRRTRATWSRDESHSGWEVAAVIDGSDSIDVVLCMVYGMYGATYKEVVNHPIDNPKAKRDTVRCLLLEKITGVPVISLDKLGNEVGEGAINGKSDRHLSLDINVLGRDNYESKVLFRSAGKIRGVYLDYVWANDFYWDAILQTSFFESSLPWLAALLKEDGFILLPLQSTIFIGVMRAKPHLVELLDISLVSLDESNNYSLVQATNSIRPEHHELFGKQPSQEQNLGCTLQRVNERLQTTECPHVVSYIRLYHQARKVEKYSFLKLSKRREAEPGQMNTSWIPSAMY